MPPDSASACGWLQIGYVCTYKLKMTFDVHLTEDPQANDIAADSLSQLECLNPSG